MYLASWSGGKDSCLACYRAIKDGIRISHLVHFVREFNLHGVDERLIRLQAGLSGIPIVQRKVLSDNFKVEFKDTVRCLINKGSNPPSPPFRKGGMGGFEIRGMVFGDIYLEPHKEWVERVCGEIGIEAVEPLWGISTEELINEFIDEGFEAVVVSGKGGLIDKEWIGRKVDRNFTEYLKTRKLDLCGENGEYHTFVISGPLFKGRIEITDSVITNRNDHWFMDIKDFMIIQ